MIVIVDEYCKGCDICIHVCPKDILEASTEVGSRGYYVPQVADGNACNNCRQCELFCPDFAIFIVEEEGSGDG